MACVTGLCPRWYVFPNIILQSSSFSCSGRMPFKVPWVPTGINTGVSTTLWGSVIFPTRAFVVEHSAIILNVKACALVAMFGTPDSPGNTFQTTNEITPYIQPIQSCNCLHLGFVRMPVVKMAEEAVSPTTDGTNIQCHDSTFASISLTHVQYTKGKQQNHKNLYY